MPIESLLARLKADTAVGTPGTPRNRHGVPELKAPKHLISLGKSDVGTRGTPGTPKNDKGRDDGGGDTPPRQASPSAATAENDACLGQSGDFQGASASATGDSVFVGQPGDFQGQSVPTAGDDGERDASAVAKPDNADAGAARDNDFSVFRVFQVFQEENKQDESIGYPPNEAEHLAKNEVFQVFQAASPPEQEKPGVPSVFFIGMEPAPAHGPILDIKPIDAERFAERAAVLEFEGGLSREEAERRAAKEMGVDSSAELYAAIAETWAERLGEILASERSPRGRECIAAALRFVADGWAVKALARGWTEIELVGVCPVAPWERLDRMGAAFSRFTPIEITAEAITYATSGAEPLRRFCGSQADGAVLPWEHVERDKPPLYEMTESLDHLPELEL